MKSTYSFKVVLSTVLAFVFILSSCIGSYAFAEEKELPHIVRWVDGAAQTSDGTYLRDTWAIDDTNVSESKYVLIGQDSLEAMRIKNYPDDISNGETTVCPTYTGSFSLSVPDGVTGEISVAFENANASYTVVFNESNSYKASAKFLPGTYEASDIDVVTDTDDKYGLKRDFSFTVSDKEVSYSLELVSLSSESEDTTDSEDEGLLDNVGKFDENNDLLKDTVKLLIAIAILFIAYAFIKRRREKAEEIKK